MSGKINLVEFQLEFRAWKKGASNYKKQSLPEVLPEMNDFVRTNPNEAGMMLSMYYLECGPIKK